MVFKKNLSATAAIILDFAKPQRVHNCQRADGIKKKLVCYSSNCPRLHNAPTSSIAQERMVFKKNLSATAAIIIDFTKPQRVYNCPRADGIKKKLVCYSSNYPRLHKAPTSSQLYKSGWYLNKPSLLQQQLS